MRHEVAQYVKFVYSFYSYDIIIDDNLKPWLIEVSITLQCSA